MFRFSTAFSLLIYDLPNRFLFAYGFPLKRLPSMVINVLSSAGYFGVAFLEHLPLFPSPSDCEVLNHFSLNYFMI